MLYIQKDGFSGGVAGSSTSATITGGNITLFGDGFISASNFRGKNVIVSQVSASAVTASILLGTASWAQNISGSIPSASFSPLQVGSITVTHVDGTTLVYNPPSNTDVARGNLLLTASLSASNGDIIELSENIYNIGNTQIDLTLGTSGSVSLKGKGKYLTTISSSFQNNPIVVIPPTGFISDLSVMGNPSLNFQIPIGSQAATTTISHSVISSVFLSASFDGINVPATCVNCFLTIRDITTNTNFDSINIAASNGEVNVYDCELNQYYNGMNTVLRGIVMGGASVLVAAWNLIVNNFSDTHIGYCAATDVGSGGELDINGGFLSSNGTGVGTTFDLFNGSVTSTLAVTANTFYQTNLTSGTITFLDTKTITNSLGKSVISASAATSSFVNLNSSTNTNLRNSGSAAIIEAGNWPFVFGPNFGSAYAGIWLAPSSDGNSVKDTDYNFLSSLTDRSLYLNRSASQAMHFRENNVEQMTIAAGGQVTVVNSLTASSITAAGGITASLRGTATNADNVSLTTTTASLAHFVPLILSNVGYQGISGSLNLTFNPGTATLSTTQINITNGTASKFALLGDTTNSSFFIGSLQMQNYALNNTWLTDNIYFDGANWRNRATGFGEKLYFVGGETQLYSIDTATAGTINTSATPALKTMVGNSVAIGGPIAIATTSKTNAVLLVSGSGLVGINKVFPTASLDVVGNIVATGGVTASLQGTSSWATNSKTASNGASSWGFISYNGTTIVSNTYNATISRGSLGSWNVSFPNILVSSQYSVTCDGWSGSNQLAPTSSFIAPIKQTTNGFTMSVYNMNSLPPPAADFTTASFQVFSY